MASGTQVYPFAAWVDAGSSGGTQVYPFALWVEPSSPPSVSPLPPSVICAKWRADQYVSRDY